MDFGQKDFDLLAKLQKLCNEQDWQRLMDHRITVIHRNVILEQAPNNPDNNKELKNALQVYESERELLKEKYGV
jgi:hypothetical protein